MIRIYTVVSTLFCSGPAVFTRIYTIVSQHN